MNPALPFRLPPPQGGRVDLLVIAGEHSGDEHAARAIRELREREPGLAIAAVGGPALESAGAQLLFDLTASSVVGLVEVLKNLSLFRMLLAEILRWTREHSPRAVCFVDYPGMNLRLAAALRERGLSVKGGGKIKALYYVSPQIWAWKSGRRFAMARDLDAMAVIFPFEVKCYADTELPVEFVGHPFVSPDFKPPLAYDPSGPVLLLPGSRTQAVSRIFPVILEGYRAFGERPALVLYPSPEIAAELRRHLPEAIQGRITLAPVHEGPAEPFLASAVLTSSGTMSMQCALAAIPGAIAYRANLLTYLLGRWLVKVPYLGIANLLLEEPMYPEFIQEAATPPALAAELRACLHDPKRREITAERSARLRSLLSHPAGTTAGAWLLRHLA